FRSSVFTPFLAAHVDEPVPQHGGYKSEDDCPDDAAQHQIERRLTKPPKDEDAEAAAADKCCYGRKTNVLHENDPNAGKDGGKRQRKLDAQQALSPRHAHATGRLPRACRYTFKPGKRISGDWEKRIGEERY